MAVTKVLVVDDSMTMRALFTSVLERGKDIVVVGAANGADEAREMIASLRPDVVTLDVEMPGKNGLEFLEELMATRPLPVIMLSTLTQKGADVTLRALELGAVDSFPKPGRATPDEFDKIAGKLHKAVLNAARTNLSARATTGKTRAVAPLHYHWDGTLLVITGGVGSPEALCEMLAAFPENCPPTLALLAIDAGIGEPLAAKLDRDLLPKVEIAYDGARLDPGTIYIAFEGDHHVAVDRWPDGVVRLIAREPINGARPSADLLLGSIAKTAKAQAVAVTISGNGEDGAAGMAALTATGARRFAQDPATALASDGIESAIAKGSINQTAAPAALAAIVLNCTQALAA